MAKKLIQIKNLDLVIVKGLSKYFFKNRIRIYFEILVIFLAYLITQIPYVNLFILPILLWPIVILVVLVISGISARSVVYIVMILLLTALFLESIGHHSSAESIGNIIYFVLWYVLVKSILEYKKL